MNYSSGAARPGRRGVVERVVRSMAFGRSREEAARIVDDPTSLRALIAAFRDGDRASTVALQAFSGRIDAALDMLECRCAELDGVLPARDLTPGRAARYRLVVAALHYVVTREQGDGTSDVDVDAVMVIREVFETVDDEIAPFLTAADEPTGGPSGRLTAPIGAGTPRPTAYRPPMADARGAATRPARTVRPSLSSRIRAV